MIGIVLAAGAGSRLLHHTEELPKTLLPVAGDDTILDVVLANLAQCGIPDVVVVTGFAAEQIDRRVPALEARHGVRIETLFNEHALTRNNGYSLWLAREHFGQGAVVVNGDTVCPASVVAALAERAGGPVDVALAFDGTKVVADEEMKVVVDGDGRVSRVSKQIDPTEASGEYIGVSLVTGRGAAPFTEALRATWEQDDTKYYDDAFEELVRRGGTVVTVPIGDVEWVEVDNEDDLARARAIAAAVRSA